MAQERQRIVRYSVPGDFGAPITKLCMGVPEKYSYASMTQGQQTVGGSAGSSGGGGRLSPEAIRQLIEALMSLDVFEWAKKAMAAEAGTAVTPSAANPTKPAPALAYSRHRGESVKYSRELEALRGNRSKAAYARRQWCEGQVRESYSRHQSESKAATDAVLAYCKSHPGTSYSQGAAAVGHAIQGEALIR